ncbi:hypothetical protein DMUE_3843 [Dictyocoela muelleri]|nr:hypothetical protein DMUE_3843 [Dictyocoela muelleri]
MFFITFTNIFSRYTRIYLEENISGKSVVDKLKLWCSEFENLETIITGNGKQYVGQYFKIFFLKIKKIKHARITAYTPFSNGNIESINEVISEGLRFNKNKKSFSEILGRA